MGKINHENVDIFIDTTIKTGKEEHKYSSGLILNPFARTTLTNYLHNMIDSHKGDEMLVCSCVSFLRGYDEAMDNLLQLRGYE